MATPRQQLTQSLLHPQHPATHSLLVTPRSPDLDADESPPTIVRIEASSSSANRQKKTPYCLAARIYIVLLLLESFILVSTAICALVSVYTWERPPDDDGRSISLSVVNTSLVALTATFGMLYFGLDALRLQHRFQLFAAIAAHTSIVLFVSIHWKSADLGVWFRRVSGGTLLMVVLCEVAYIGLSFPVLQSFGRRMFDRLRSSSAALAARYQTAEIFFSLLKIDCYLQLLLVMLAALFVTKYVLELLLNIAQIAVTVAWFWLGNAGVRREDKAFMQIFAGLTVLQPLYIASKLHAVHTDSSSYPQYTYEQFWAVAWMAVLVRGAVLAWAWFCFKGFGGGLKERLWDRPVKATATAAGEGAASTTAAAAGAVQEPKRVRVIRVHDDSEMTDMSSAAAAGHAEGQGQGQGQASAPSAIPASRVSYPRPMLHDHVADSAPRVMPPREFFQQQRLPLMPLSSRAMAVPTANAAAAASSSSSSSAAAPDGTASPGDYVLVDGSVSPPDSPLTHSVMVSANTHNWSTAQPSSIALPSTSMRNESIV